MGLLELAPGVQEGLLVLPANNGCDPISEHQLRPIAAAALWREQERVWAIAPCKPA